MAQKFKKGDIVQLTSGGPNMTFEKYDRDIGWDFNRKSQDVVIRVWFDSDKNLQTRQFEQDALKKIE